MFSYHSRHLAGLHIKFNISYILTTHVSPASRAPSLPRNRPDDRSSDVFPGWTVRHAVCNPASCLWRKPKPTRCTIWLTLWLRDRCSMLATDEAIICTMRQEKKSWFVQMTVYPTVKYLYKCSVVSRTDGGKER